MADAPRAPDDATLAAATREVRDLLATSQNLAAVELARATLRGVAPLRAPRLTYLHALASARAGAPDTAARQIAALRALPGLDAALTADVDSLAGRLAKDVFIDSGEAAALDEAIAAYRRVAAGSTHARINVASLLMLRGEAQEARALARSVVAELDRADNAPDHWAHATRGEAQVLLGGEAQAGEAYARARVAAGGRFGDVASMRRQLHLLARALPAAAVALAAIPGPRLIAFSGHMIDLPGRATPRFPPALAPAVAAAIDAAVAASGPVIGYAQAACGGDILFCESLIARGMELNVVLPFARDDYRAASVSRAGPAWEARFERVLAAATAVTFATSERHLGDDSLFEHASELIQGMAFLRARELEVEPSMLVLSDAGQAGDPGGTLATQGSWARQDRAVEVIDLAALRARHPAPAAAAASPAPAPPPREAAAGRAIKSLLFADVKGFSRLPEEFSPAFFTAFLGLVPATLGRLGITPAELSTRGDGLYAVFDSPEDAAAFALTLSTAVGGLDWAGMGLPADTHVRIALHAGPVFAAMDPVTGRLAHFGTHVTRAARVEPVVVPGQVLVTEPFAAVLASRRDTRYRCDLVGTEPLAKGYGIARLYRLRQRAMPGSL